MNNYLEILNLFVTKDELRPPMTKPNIGDKYASSTDAHSLVFFDKNLLPSDINFQTIGKYPDISIFVNVEENLNNLLSIDKINSTLEKCPLIEDFDEEEKEDTCDECNGSGEVEVTYEDKKLKDHDIDVECPICEGHGKCTVTIEKPNGKMVRNNEYYVQCGNSFMSIYLIERLLKVSELLCEEIFLVNQITESQFSVFRIGKVKVLLMPLMRNEDSDYFLGNIA
jgi:Zn finger protein HypA/HybF involved in hydrogenase expression